MGKCGGMQATHLPYLSQVDLSVGGFGNLELGLGPKGVYNLVGKKEKCIKENTRRQQMTKFL